MEPPSSSTTSSSSAGILGGGLRDHYRLPNNQPWSIQSANASTSGSTTNAGRSNPSGRHSHSHVTSSPHSDSRNLQFRPRNSLPPLNSVLKSLVASVMLQYTSTAIAMPWEVARTLLQVQWVPNNSEGSQDGADDEEEYEDEDSDEEPENHDHNSYFADPDATPTLPSPRPNPPNAIIPSSERDESPTSHVLFLPSHGVWSTIKRITRQPSEGYLALWKGLLTSSITEVVAGTIQPLIHGTLLPAPEPFPNYHPNNSSILVPLTSHLLTGILLSPLDLVRTRLIVQPLHPPQSAPPNMTYTGPLHALYSIYKTEGGFRGLYIHPQLLIPTILDSTLRPLVSLTFPQMILETLGLGYVADDPENNRVLWALAELGGNFLGLLVMLPLETVRRRLQVQVRAESAKAETETQDDGGVIASCVQLRPRPYRGVVDCLWRILTEEKSDPFLQSHSQHRRRKQIRRQSTSTRRPSTAQSPESRPQPGKVKEPLLPGLAQLYQGFSMRLGASLVVFILSMLGDSGDSEGWAEL
ncbi:hypothetical protein V5O48_004396 [Marasmius crinis-equi]|uniref:Mitochondrial carrier n=1 Tax=Marasmius crinis-equi TaxID=585013 RepID=A0ABR3FQB6_9AGAR